MKARRSFAVLLTLTFVALMCGEVQARIDRTDNVAGLCFTASTHQGTIDQIRFNAGGNGRYSSSGGEDLNYNTTWTQNGSSVSFTSPNGAFFSGRLTTVHGHLAFKIDGHGTWLAGCK